MQSNIGVAILRAIEQSALELTGSPLVDPQLARESIVMTLASLLEAQPHIASDDDLVENIQSLAADLFAYAKSMRATYERTGRRVWASIAPPGNGSYALQ